jgi:Icc-related predicted phosphoesterase
VSVTVVALADTHGFHEKLVVPDGDVLIHAGDLTQRGTAPQLEAVRDWLRRLPHAHKVVVAGNHDFLFEDEPERARALFADFTYLEDAEAQVAGLRVWGSPWQPWFHQWAFNLHRGPPIEAKWRRIPSGLDVLVTHGPPAGYGDRCFDGREVGCEDLLRHLRRARPRFHLFGHIHEARGQWQVGATRACNVTTAEGELPVTVLEV